MEAPTVNWPTLEDFRTWLGPDLQESTDWAPRTEAAFHGADGVIRERLIDDLLPFTEDEESGLKTYLCPSPVSSAIKLLGGRFFTRRDSLGGVLGFAEYGVRLAKTDPDVYLMIAPWVEGTEP